MKSWKATGQRRPLQIFATDIEAEGINKARAGEYPDSIAADVSPERLKKYFIKKDGVYRIKQEIREIVVYAVQISSATRRSPGSTSSVAATSSSTWTPIYRKQILPLFHFTLNPNGYLFLGTSESIGGSADLFAPVSNTYGTSSDKNC